MLSGIGPKSELKKHNIKQIIDLPVGQNLQDHCLVYAGFRVGRPRGQMTLDTLGLLNPLYLLQYTMGGGRGPWSSTGVGAVGVLNTITNKLSLPGDSPVFIESNDIGWKALINLFRSANYSDNV